MTVFRELFSRECPNCSTVIPLKNRVALIYKKAIICQCCNQKLLTTILWALLMAIPLASSGFFLAEPLGSLIAFDINDDEI
jgi:hypothetical protein